MPIDSVPTRPSLERLPALTSPPSSLGSGNLDRLGEILRAAGDRMGSWQSVYDLFDEMLDKDGHLYSVIQTRIYGVLGRERSVIPASDAPRDVAMAAWVREALGTLPGWEEALRDLLSQWREVSQYYFADFYPCLPYSRDDHVWIGWQFHDDEKNEGRVQEALLSHGILLANGWGRERFPYTLC